MIKTLPQLYNERGTGVLLVQRLSRETTQRQPQLLLSSRQHPRWQCRRSHIELPVIAVVALTSAIFNTGRIWGDFQREMANTTNTRRRRPEGDDVDVDTENERMERVTVESERRDLHGNDILPTRPAVADLGRTSVLY